MAELVWSASGQRFFEAGVDRGVLFPPTGPGVPWNGITSIEESTDGGAATAFYSDGYKYLNLASSEEFKAKIQAMSAPPEFAECDGTKSLLNGLFITQQIRKSFSFSYRTKIGNDIDGAEHGYKIHIVYNALAAPTGRSNQTLSNSLSPMELSWDITTTPPDINGYRPSAHFVIDSRNTPPAILAQFEGMLYGTSTTEPYLPTVPQIMEHFASLITIELLQEKPGGILQLEKVPAIRHSIKPIPAPGQKVLWLDTSAGDYAKLTLVTGE